MGQRRGAGAIARRLILSDAAELDLKGIASFSVERWGVGQADKYRKQMRVVLDRVLAMPASGRKVPEEPEVRSILSGSHRIYYRFDDRMVRIDRILHTSMDAPRHLP